MAQHIKKNEGECRMSGETYFEKLTGHNFILSTALELSIRTVHNTVHQELGY
jgi:hypothetical protein